MKDLFKLNCLYRNLLSYCKLFFFSVLVVFCSGNAYGQKNNKVNPALLDNRWDAQWITFPGASLKEYGVFHFRRTFVLDKRPQEFIIHVSGDNRYKLFVNGSEVCNGPARGDLAHWRFESIDISDKLVVGKNILAAEVWNFGIYIPLAQTTNKTAFIVQGNTDHEKVVNTGNLWKTYKNEAYTPPTTRSLYTVVGPGDHVDGAKYPYGWELINFKDDSWSLPQLLGNGTPYGKFTGWEWMLVPRNIPFMEHTMQKVTEIERTQNIIVDKEFLEGDSPLKIPANKSVKILLDQTYLTSAYPELIVSGGKGAEIKIGYAEALIDQNGKKGNRNDTKDKVLFTDNFDVFRPDGGNNRRFSTLWFRTFRYLELTIETKGDPLLINNIYSFFTAYPFQQNAYFKSDNKSLDKIWETGWRTLRLCAVETYFDCPYYEQLQYIGDTRIQALISLYVSGDDRLMRNAIEQFHQSMLPTGLTLSRYPTSEAHVIPPFSLFWIAMVHDYWMYRDDEKFIKNQLNGIV